MKISYIGAVRFSGIIWLGVGLMLMMKGLPLLVNASKDESLPLIQLLSNLAGNAEQAAMVLVVLGLMIGMIKGKTVLAKAARKGMLRLKGFSDPLPLAKIYAVRYYVLLSLMIALGISLRFLGIPADIHGLVDLAIGSALINGALVYFREGSSIANATAQGK